MIVRLLEEFQRGNLWKSHLAKCYCGGDEGRSHKGSVIWTGPRKAGNNIYWVFTVCLSQFT